MLWIETTYEGHPKRAELAGEPVRIGRSADCDLSFPGDKQMSRMHATFESRPNGWFVIDNKSTNGSYVNGQRVTVPFPIKEGDIIEVGDQRLRVCQGIELPKS
jgi:pSer/pThr/pTyr-binding forkhead associated (FHA) protein